MTEEQTTPTPDATDVPGAEAPQGPTATTEESGPTRTEEFTISANKLLGKVKDLIAEGNVRKIIIHNESGRTLLEIPLNAGLAVTAAGAFFAPVLVAVGALAALLTSVSVTVVREASPVAAPEAPVEHDHAHDHAM